MSQVTVAQRVLRFFTRKVPDNEAPPVGRSTGVPGFRPPDSFDYPANWQPRTHADLEIPWNGKFALAVEWEAGVYRFRRIPVDVDDYLTEQRIEELATAGRREPRE